MTTETLTTRAALQELVGQLYDYATAGIVETWPDSDGKISYDPVHRLVNAIGQYAAREAYYRTLASGNAQKRAQEERRSFSKAQRAKARERILSAAISEQNAATWLDASVELEEFCTVHGIDFEPFTPPQNAAEVSDADFAEAEKALAVARARREAILAA